MDRCPRSRLKLKQVPDFRLSQEAGMALRGAAGVARRRKVEKTVRSRGIGCTMSLLTRSLVTRSPGSPKGKSWCILSPAGVPNEDTPL
jgi:hypothetical protein